MMPHWFAYYMSVLPANLAGQFWDWLELSGDAREDMMVAINADKRWKAPDSCWVELGCAVPDTGEVELTDPETLKALYTKLDENMRKPK